MSGYTIAAIPTLYRGRMYRSRLEARWAAFFDRLGWTHEYEPFDLRAWSPDFLLTDLDVLVEVKPITDWDQAVIDKMCDANGDRKLLLTTVAPELIEDISIVNLGWYAGLDRQFYHATVGWVIDPSRPRFMADMVFADDGDDKWRTAAGWTGSTSGSLQGLRFYGDYTMGLWADASNAVQWEPTR